MHLVSGDWDLGNALTQRQSSARGAMLVFLRTWKWKLRFDPDFIVAAKKKNRKAADLMQEVLKMSMAEDHVEEDAWPWMI